jgi:hypothetical protein
MCADDRDGWHWPAFFLGPFWYISKGMTLKGVILLLICIFTCLAGVPVILIYTGFKGKSDYYERQLQAKGNFNINNI